MNQIGSVSTVYYYRYDLPRIYFLPIKFGNTKPNGNTRYIQPPLISLVSTVINAVMNLFWYIFMLYIHNTYSIPPCRLTITPAATVNQQSVDSRSNSNAYIAYRHVCFKKAQLLAMHYFLYIFMSFSIHIQYILIRVDNSWTHNCSIGSKVNLKVDTFTASFHHFFSHHHCLVIPVVPHQQLHPSQVAPSLTASYVILMKCYTFLSVVQGYRWSSNQPLLLHH